MIGKFLYRPTVADVVSCLLELPQNAQFSVEDADTWWIIRKIHIDVSDEQVTFSGKYSEMEG